MAEPNASIEDLSANPFYQTADNYELSAAKPSIFEQGFDVATKGTVLTGVSIVRSFYNTAKMIGSWATGQKYEESSAEDWIKSVDYSGDMFKYYKEHEMGIEAAGLIAGSFIPGTLAVKAIKLAAGTKATGAFGRMMGYQTKLTEEANAFVNAAKPVTLFDEIQRTKFAGIAAGFGEQAVYAAGWELATLATMKANPTISQDGFKDMASHVFYGALVGGVVGGALSGFVFNGVVKNAWVTSTNRELVEKHLTDLGKIDLIHGDKAAMMLKGVDELVEEAATKGTRAEQLASQTAKRAQQEISATLSKITPEEQVGVQDEFVKFLLRTREEGGMTSEEVYDKLAGLARIRRISLSDTLAAAEARDMERTVLTATKDQNTLVEALQNLWPPVTHLRQVLGSDLAHIIEQNSDELLEDYINAFINSATAPGKFFGFPRNKAVANKYNPDGYRFEEWSHNSATGKKHAGGDQFMFETKQEAQKFKDDFVATVNTIKKQFPNGKKATNAGTAQEEKYTDPRIINIFTGKETNGAYAVLGDLGTNVRLSASKDSVVVGEGARTYTFKQATPGEGFGPALAEKAPQAAVARYVYAHLRKLDEADFAGHKAISVEDIPFMEQLLRQWDQTVASKEGLRMSIKILDSQGKRIDVDPILGAGGFVRTDVADMVLEQKQLLAKRLFAEGMDMEQIALRTNVPYARLEDGTLFSAFSGKDVEDFMRPISELMQTNHVALQYETKALQNVDGNLVSGMMHIQERIEAAQNTARTAAANFLQATGARNPDAFFIEGSAMQADVLGASPSFFGNRDPNPGTLAARVQNVGAAFKQQLNKLVQEAFDTVNPALNALRANKEATAEHILLDNIMRGTAEKYALRTPDHANWGKLVKQLQDLGMEGTENIQGLLVRKGMGEKITKEDFVPLTKQVAEPGVKGKYSVYPIQHSETVAAMQANMRVNEARLQHNIKLLEARGQTKEAAEMRNWLDSYYAPAMDTTRYKHVVFVKEIDRLNGTHQMHAVVAKDFDSMNSKIRQIQERFPEYEVFTREQLKKEFRNRGNYEFEADLQSASINSSLARKGIIHDLLPDLNAENHIDNYLRWHSGQTRRLLTGYTELANSQLFAELTHFGKEYSDLASSKVGFLASKFGGKQERNPFQEYIDTALDISPKYHSPLWNDINDKAEALYSKAFNVAAKTFQDASKGLVSWEEANAIAERMGLGNPYRSMEALADVSQRIPNTHLNGLVRTGNSIIAATQVRLDMFQSLINVVSTPILLLAQASSAKFAALKEATSVAVPGSGELVPSGTKVMFRAIGNFWGEEKTKLMDLYRSKGLVPDVETMKSYHAMIEDLATAPGHTKFGAKMSAAVDKAATLTGANFAEDFSRFITADAGRQLYEAMGMKGEELWSAVRVFTNRVQGNYIASQRPVVFQGVLGQAVGLFQTYQFNLMQQLFRFIEEGDKRSLAILGAMQGSLYGLQGMPGFNILNTHIVGSASGNAAHSDIFTGVNSYAGKDVAEWLLYGSLSNILHTGLYTRGDINPRQVTVLPINPLDWPAISGARRFLENVKNTAGQMLNGASTYEALLYGIEHNGLSRPMAGVAQLWKGESTTAGNQLVSAVDWNNISNLSRVFGSRPLNEAIAMDAMYRKTLYDQLDTQRLKSLGAAVRGEMLGGKSPSEDQLLGFMDKYAAAGGRPERFGGFIAASAQKANTAAANELITHLNNPKAQNIYRLMGGEPLPDYNNLGSTAVAPTE